jgi:outer membrane receptor protein involved in Fe transport
MKIHTALKYLIILLITLESKAVEPETLQSVDAAVEKTTPEAAPVKGKKQDSKPATNPEAAAEAEEIFVLGDFVVSAEEDRGYFSANSTSATRTNALVKNTPITLTVINEQMMEDLNILNDQDLAQVTASVTEDPDGFSLNQLRIRGFRSLTQRYDLFWRELERDGYNIQRVDIVKGANSLIYGQADPGGQINSVPKIAQHNKNFINLKETAGNNKYLRHEIDANYIINDQLAARVMAFDSSRDLDQLYEFVDQTGATLELSLRPNKNTQLRAHIEHMKLNQNLAPGMFKMTSRDKRFEPNSPRDDLLGGNPSFSLGTYLNEFIYSPDAIDLIPQAIIDDLILDDSYAQDELGLADETAVTRDILKQVFAPWANQDDRYSVTGPDKYNKRDGLITTVDWTQKISDALQLKLAFNREAVDREALARDGYSAGRVSSDDTGARAFEPYVKTYWRKQDGTTEAHALKSTLLYEFEQDSSKILPFSGKHKLLFGLDYDLLEKDPKMFEQVSDKSRVRTGGFYRGADLNNETFYLSDGFGLDVPNIRYNGNDDLFQLRQDNNLEVETKSAWFAVQSEFLGGRLRSLVGLRYDKIDINYDIMDYRFGVSDAYVENNLGEDYSKAATQIKDGKGAYDQFSPTVGALYWLTPELGFFANYAQSIQSPNEIVVNPLGEIIPPVYGEGFEYGIRFEVMEGKLNGQIAAFYIEKENDNIVNYDGRLGDIYTFAEYGQSHPQIFKPDEDLNYNLLPGKRVAGDKSRAEGIEVECYYNPNRNLSFILSYTYNNLDAIKINENVNPRFAQVWGQAPHNALLIGRYKFTDGALKGLSIGANQSFRSKSTIGEWYIEDDNDASGEGTWYEIDFDPEFVTSGFVNYECKLGSLRASPKLNLGLRVNNIFDNTDLINRNKGAYHRPSRQILVSAKIAF